VIRINRHQSTIPLELERKYRELKLDVTFDVVHGGKQGGDVFYSGILAGKGMMLQRFNTENHTTYVVEGIKEP
jgi:hypothetical protein